MKEIKFNELGTSKFKIIHETEGDQSRLSLTIGQHAPCYINVNDLPELLNLLDTFQGINHMNLRYSEGRY